jgi:hypothetical protein
MIATAELPTSDVLHQSYVENEFLNIMSSKNILIRHGDLLKKILKLYCPNKYLQILVQLKFDMNA